MQILTRRVGALALAATVFAASFAAAGSGAFAQDQADHSALPNDPTQVAEQADAPQVRFVPGERVQPLPALAVDSAAVRAVDAETLAGLVASVDAGNELSGELTCLAQAVYFEARGEPLEGQLAVARVVINRADSGRFAASYCGVVTQRGQFSFVRSGRIPAPDHGSANWQRARAIALIAHQDLWDSAAADALYFHATSVRPGWAGRLQARATINRHVFYR